MACEIHRVIISYLKLKFPTYQAIFQFVLFFLACYRILAPEDWPKIDLIAMALILAMFFPYLTSLVSELSVSGIFSAKFRQIEQKVDHIAERQVINEDAVLAMPPSSELHSAEPKSTVTEGNSTEEEIISLANQYFTTRQTMASGSHRTSVMTKIMQRMISAASDLGTGWHGRDEWVKSPDPGKKLASVASFIALPTEDGIGVLVDNLNQDDKPFVQYWILRAIRICLQEFGIENLTADRQSKLETAMRWSGQDTDRHTLLEMILRMAKEV